jgi:hypothetical protein
MYSCCWQHNDLEAKYCKTFHILLAQNHTASTIIYIADTNTKILQPDNVK